MIHTPPNSTPCTPHRAPSRLAALPLAGLVLLSAACVVEDEPLAESDDAAPLEIEREGRVFEWLGPVVEQEVEPGPEAVIRPLTATLVDEGTEDDPDGIAEVIETADERPLDTWTREELADALRPVIATSDGLYLSQEPAWDMADAVLLGDAEPFTVDVLDREGEGRPTVDPVDELVPRAIIGGDDRMWISNTQAAPYRNIVKLQLYSGNTYRGWCTGSYIGPWTLITAGHCLVFSNTDRINRIVFQPGRSGASLPYGSFDCRLDDASTSNDYLWSVPAGYYTGQNGSLDYAVLDTFPCHGAPNWFPGYQANTGNTSYSMYGYTSGTCPAAPGANDYMCGMSGPAELNEWRIETPHIDSNGGQSGAPWYGWFGGALRPAAVHVGYREYFDFFKCGFDVCRRNFSRRIDNAFNSFIIDVAWDF